MTPQEFRSNRKRLGLTMMDMGSLLDVSDRTIRAWEYGEVHGRPCRVPHMAAMIVRLAVRHQTVRNDLGLSIEPERGRG